MTKQKEEGQQTAISNIDFLIKNVKDIKKYLAENNIFETEKTLKNMLVSLKTAQDLNGYGFIIVSGCGGSGKTKMAKYLMQYLKEKRNADFNIIATDENTSTDTLLARIGADSLMSQNGEKIVIGEMGEALRSAKNIVWDEINRTPFENIQKIMTLLSEKAINHRGEVFNIPAGTIIIATANLGSKGTYPLAQEFKQRADLIEVKYTQPEMKRILYQLFDKDGAKVDIGMALFNKTLDYAKEGKNGWNYEASVRTINQFTSKLLNSLAFGIEKDEAIRQAVKSVLIQFTDESSLFIQRRNEDLQNDIKEEINTTIDLYKLAEAKR